ncbi:MAG TPA: chemotaxis protein CheW [Verrucomicrobiae bacterium]|nr:chemotaxis protein CheW [Verrucomicrobiae bacterium]
MLFLLFQLGNDRYALEAKRIVEIVPLLALKTIPQAPKGVAGLLVYRGRAIPALDLCDLTFGRPARERMSTRIIIVNYSEAPGHHQWLGLIAERATEMMQRDVRDFVEAGVKPTAAPFLGPVLIDARGIIQLLHAQKLLTENVRELLFAGEVPGAEVPGIKFQGSANLTPDPSHLAPPLPPRTSEEASQ